MYIFYLWLPQLFFNDLCGYGPKLKVLNMGNDQQY